ncbi:MAG: hypothetical protein CL666_13990 [Balneola sp.]|nr:hypothetical protein [Balneola sp.]|tara:strand:- start:45371 stop:46681 length:1311 start_codon:yes stop_codon:yes gene_type:complete
MKTKFLNKVFEIDLKIESVNLYFLVAFFAFYAFEGVLRYFFSILQLEPLLYVKDLIILYLIIYFFFEKIKYYKLSEIQFYIVLLLTYSSLIGLIYLSSFAQILFGFKVLIPLIVGMVGFQFFIKNRNKLSYSFIALGMITAFGVLLDLYFPLPWTDLTFEIGGVDVQSSQEVFVAGGFGRISGFARNWSVSAMIMMVSITHLLFLSSVKWKLPISLLLFVMVIITTNKGIIVGTFLVISFYIFKRFKIGEHIYRFGYKILIALTVLLPFFAGYIYSTFQGQLEGIYRIVFNSLFVRFSENWPEALELITVHGNPLLGRGLGSIAASQKIFEANLYNPADNYFLYLYAIVGFISVLILVLTIVHIRRLNFKNNIDAFCFAILLASGLYAIIGTLIENPIFGFFVGIAYARLFLDEGFVKKLKYPFSGMPIYLKKINN